ncbi:hypothetical protein [Flammeovirga kamogawensis]|uniref:STAS/SEC14 domain-containing protein n=1 Tax=Flammeovirga kamogawensis TaxID=373891 RepID=A0ABX8GZJ0_9BACT|nr:hypothetical protein [Flammeovirga kamogawensis]MBB6462858.1 hypothetical protein [Flammeovirga kamogawensis]QWG08360.1 hypothetical protein KM029_05340 [Flammeovirga kamogawensis]TRX66656.1 hypothetical protein EO216_00400 [Flammeovirga kamogawensis]
MTNFTTDMNSRSSTLTIRMRGYFQTEQFSELFETSLKDIQNGKPLIVLLDARFIKSGWMSANPWLVSWFLPKIALLKVKHFGVIIEEDCDPFTRFSVINLESLLENEPSLKINLFESPEEAVIWGRDLLKAA